MMHKEIDMYLKMRCNTRQYLLNALDFELNTTYNWN